MGETVLNPKRGRIKLDRAVVDASVLAAVEEGPTHGRAIARLLRIHIKIVRESLARLCRMGRIERVGEGSHVRFVLPGQPHPNQVFSETADRGRPLQLRVLDFLQKNPRPFFPSEIADELGVSRRQISTAVCALVQRGEAAGRGNAQARVVGLPHVIAALPPLEPSRRSWREYHARRRSGASGADVTPEMRLERAVRTVLGTGASYTVRGIWCRVRQKLADVTPEAIEARCLAMVREGRAARHVVGSAPHRYQLRVPVRLSPFVDTREDVA